MKKILYSIIASITFAATGLQAGTLFVVDKRTSTNTKTGQEEKYPHGFFIGIEFKGKIFYKPVTPNGEITKLDSKLESVDAIYMYEPAMKLFIKLPIIPKQPGVLLGGAVLEVAGSLNKDLKFTYYHKNKPSKKIELNSNKIKIWQEVAAQ